MFHEVKIFDKKGNVKKVLSSKKLSKNYWNSFFNNPFSEAMDKKKGRPRKPQKNVDCDDENLDSTSWLDPINSGNGDKITNLG